MMSAMLISMRSKDPIRKVGACIVDEGSSTIISSGYNGFIRKRSHPSFKHQKNNDDFFTWEKPDKHFYVVHAEANAILSLIRNGGCNNSQKGFFTLYTTLYPCVECSKLIIQSGIINKIVYLEDYCKNKIYTDKLFDFVKNDIIIEKF